MRPLSRPLIVIVGAHAVVLCVAVAMTIRLVWGWNGTGALAARRGRRVKRPEWSPLRRPLDESRRRAPGRVTQRDTPPAASGSLYAFRLSRWTLSLPGASNMTAKGQSMSDRILFSMGGVSMIFVFMALAMFWPV